MWLKRERRDLKKWLEEDKERLWKKRGGKQGIKMSEKEGLFLVTASTPSLVLPWPGCVSRTSSQTHSDGFITCASYACPTGLLIFLFSSLFHLRLPNPRKLALFYKYWKTKWVWKVQSLNKKEGDNRCLYLIIFCIINWLNGNYLCFLCQCHS